MHKCSDTRAIRVVHFERKPYGAYFSIERVFDAVRRCLPAHLEVERRPCRFRSRGLFRRLLNLAEAPFHRGDINHITGDVHYLALALPKRGTILTIHDCVGLRFVTGFKLLTTLWLWYRLPANRVAAITAISEFTRDEVLRSTRCRPEIIRVIYDPLPPGFSPCARTFDQDRPVLLQVGTGEHNKNIVRVAEALRGIRCHLNVIGRLTERQRRALDGNRISYREQAGLTGEEIIQRYRDSDMVIVASTYEGFGMPVIEANAMGRPVVASNACSLPEVAGRAACLVDPWDCESIRRGVLRVISHADYRNRLVERGFENVKRFEPARIAAQYAALYQEVLSRR